MPEFERAEIEEFWQSWLDANRRAEEAKDWKPLADFYAEDATYGWMYHPDEHFMAVGRDEIREYALGTEMYGMDGWTYEYVATVIDDRAGMIVGFWRQRSGILDENGDEYEIAGIGGSWFGYAGGGQFAWQRDWFDLNSTSKTFLDILQSGRAPEPLARRMSMDPTRQPGHYKPADLPSTVWPPVVDRVATGGQA